jgi:hypothetical protein
LQNPGFQFIDVNVQKENQNEVLKNVEINNLAQILVIFVTNNLEPVKTKLEDVVQNSLNNNTDTLQLLGIICLRSPPSHYFALVPEYNKTRMGYVAIDDIKPSKSLYKSKTVF